MTDEVTEKVRYDAVREGSEVCGELAGSCLLSDPPGAADSCCH